MSSGAAVLSGLGTLGWNGSKETPLYCHLGFGMVSRIQLAMKLFSSPLMIDRFSGPMGYIEKRSEAGLSSALSSGNVNSSR